MHKRFSGDALAEVLRLHAQGSTAVEIAERFGTGAVVVRRTLRREGATLKRGQPPRKFSQDEIEEIVARYMAGESQKTIAESLRTSQPRISRTLRAEGIRTGRTHLQGTKHPRWKGGRLVLGGYQYLWIDTEHPLAGMRQSQGYVAEHRFVVAESLGRPLAPHETVHHINGDRADNRLENLQLRNGRHGNGHVLVCRSCGSYDIGEAPLG